MTQSIETSATGLKLAYARFISDSGPGFAVLLVIAFQWPAPLPRSWSDKPQYDVLIAAVLFLLATPVGLVMNAVSFFLLELTSARWVETIDLYDELVESHRPDFAHRIEHLRGLKRFVVRRRSFA